MNDDAIASGHADRMVIRKSVASIPERPRVSVLIPTKNRSADLVMAIRSVLAQSVLPMEVLVADQSSDDGGRKLVQAEFAETSTDAKNTVELRYLTEPNISGAAEARNQL